MMYTRHMRRIQIYIEEDIDDALAQEANRSGTSKAALIREFVGERIRPMAAPQEDPISSIIGAVDCDPARVDDVVYGH